MNRPETETPTLSAQYTRLMRRTPMLRVVAGLAVGILLAEYLPLPAAALWTAVGIGLAGLVAGAFSRRQWVTRLFLCGLWITLIGAGGLLVHLHLPDDPFRSLEKPSRTRVMQLRLTDTPHPTKSGYKVPVEVEAYVESGRWCATHGGLMLFLPSDSTVEALRYGQRIVVRGTPRRPSGEENPGQFNYQRYLRHRSVLWQCRLAKGGWVPSTAKETPQGFKAWTKRLQWTLVQRIRNSQLTPSQQGIAEAMLLGWRDDTDPQTAQQFRDAGIAHLLCVSGLHVGIVALLVRSLLFFLGRRRWQRIIKGTVQLAVVWLFVCLTGMAPATLRAGMMFSLMIVGDTLARHPNTANHLATSAVLLLCLRPMLLFDVGFQLSYAAVAGIVIGYKPMVQLIITPPYQKIGWRPVWGLWKLTCLSTVAQLATLPLTLYYFHQFPLYFLIANILIVPFASLLLGTMLAMVASYGWPWLCDVITEVLRLELTFVDGLTRWVGSLPHAMPDSLYCDLPMALLLGLAVGVAFLWLRQRQRWMVPALLGCLVLALAWLRIVDYRAARQEAIVAYAAGRHWAVEYLCGHESYLVADSVVAADPSTIDYQRSGLLRQRRIRHTTVLSAESRYADTRCAVMNHGIRFGRHLLYIVDRTNAYPFRHYAPLPEGKVQQTVELLLVAPDTWVDTAHLDAWFRYDTLLHRQQKAWTCGLE